MEELLDEGQLRIVIIARHYWPRPGAATVRLQALVAEWRRRGAEVHVIAAREAESSDHGEGPSGEKIRRIRADAQTGVGIRRVAELLQFGFAAGRIARRLRPDVIITDPPPTSGVAALAAHSPAVVYYIADAWAQMLAEGGSTGGQLLGALVRPLERAVLRRSDLVIAVRENLANYARDAGARNVLTAPYGTDLQIFKPDGPTWADPWDRKLPYFLYAGNYGVVQGASVFADAAAKLWRDGQRFGVVFMGYGSDERVVAAAANEFPELCKLLPPKPPEVAAAAFRGAVAGLASMRPLEVASQTRPAKALAAVACGCPVLFAGEGAFAEEVTAQGLGRAVPWEPGPVAEALHDLLVEAKTSNPDVRRAVRSRLASFAAEELDLSKKAVSIADEIDKISNAVS